MGPFSAKRHRSIIEEPGRLTYLEGNDEFVFPAYDDDGEVVIVAQPTRRRLFLLFGWCRVSPDLPASDKDHILSTLLNYFHEAGRPARLFDRGNVGAQSFAFHPEFFELRSRALDALAERGYEQFSAYGSIDLLHEEYGLEVCGIHEENSVDPIIEIMKATFPQWHNGKVCRCGNTGWKISLYMFRGRCGGGRCAVV